jgi:hypothetical protein
MGRKQTLSDGDINLMKMLKRRGQAALLQKSKINFRWIEEARPWGVHPLVAALIFP